MALSTDELSQIKYLLGYGNLTVLARPWFDIALVFEDVVKNNMDSWGETQTRGTILPNLLQLETDMMACRTRFAADKVGDTERNKTELRDLEALYEVWIVRLEKVTKVSRAQMKSANNSVEVT